MPEIARITPAHSPEIRLVSILGATGSIGESTLRVLAEHPTRYRIAALTAQNNAEKLIAQAQQFKPELVAIGNSIHYSTVKDALDPLGIRVTTDMEEAASHACDISVAAIVGAAGLKPTLRAIEQGKHVALANKESIVCAGSLMLQACARHGTQLVPVDSEHNAIFQVLSGAHETVEKITLTASGGPLRTRPADTFASVTVAEAVNHPRWNMGAKISVDSATMANKGLEMIEAHYLFSMPEEKIDVLVHPESIIHSLVHFTDGSVLAQLGEPDMRIPIAYALSWPERIAVNTPRLNLAQMGKLTFEPADMQRFTAIALAREALRAGAAHCIAFNAANEIAVAHFLSGKAGFTDISATIAHGLESSETRTISSIDDVLAHDHDCRARATAFLTKG
jgi:1-deoxy-D-xylulose-5-phosphate reductoisomerase